MIQLRPYQREAVDSVYSYWEKGGGSPLIDLGTGLGKSLVAATFCKELLEGWPSLRIGVVTHVKELIAQNAQEMMRLWPQAPIGINSAGLGRRDLRSKILFCGIQSVHRKGDALGNFDVLLVDEAHLIPRRADTMYGSFIADCRERVPDMRMVLLTASPFRTDSGRLDKGKNALADKITYSYGIAEGVRDGYLVPLLSKQGEHRNDISGVKVQSGEFAAKDLQEAAMPNVRPAVEELVDWGRSEGRRGWLVFSAGVKHAQAVRDEVRRHGVSCEVVTGDMPGGERDRIIKAYKAGQITCIASVNCILTGFNAPHVDLLAWMRDTLSPVIWIQGNGRGTRVVANLHGLDSVDERLEAIASSLKPNCRVLDFTNNSRRLGPVDAINVRERNGGEDFEKVKPDDIRAKECPQCGEMIAIQCRRCPHCEYVYPVIEQPKHEARADGEAIIMASITPPKWLTVNSVTYSRHTKPGRPDSLRVSYRCGLQAYDEWVALESERARGMASAWWRKMAGHSGPVPLTVTEALERLGDLAQPREILVKPEGKYWRIVAHRVPSRVEVAA